MSNMLKRFALIGSKIAGVLGLVALPTLASAQGFGSGMLLPAGTTANVTDAFTDYFFPTLLATIFQPQIIAIVVVCAAVYVMWRIIRGVWSRISHPGH